MLHMNNQNNQLWAQKIYSLRGYNKEEILNGARAIDLGCGSRKLLGADGIDSISLPGVNIVHDLDTFPWPIADNTYDMVFASHFLEHSKDVVEVMNEVGRILKPGGKFVFQVPYFRSVDAFNDPTHESFFSSGSMDYFIDGTKHSSFCYSKARFEKVGFWYGWPHKSPNFLKEIFKKFIYKNNNLYDQYLSLLFPTECLTWELKVKK